jgi:hypothetical protein
MVTVEHARQLLGDNAPTDPELLELLDSTVKRNGEEWVKEHKSMLNSQWGYVETLL